MLAVGLKRTTVKNRKERLLFVIHLPHVQDFAVEGAQKMLDGGMLFGILAEALFFGALLLASCGLPVIFRALLFDADANAEVAARHLAAHFAQQLDAFRLRQIIAQML